MTLHPNQIKILQALQQGLFTVEAIAQSSNLSVDLVNYYIHEMENDYLQRPATETFNTSPWELTNKGKIAATDPDSLLPSERSAKYDLRNAKFGGGFAAERGTQTGGTLNDYSIHIGQNLDDIDRLIASLYETIQQFPTEQQKEAEAELIDLVEDIKTPAKHDPERFGRRLKRIAAAGTAALTISGGAATFSGNLDKFAGNMVELTEKLQVPIEYVQSHLPK